MGGQLKNDDKTPVEAHAFLKMTAHGYDIEVLSVLEE